MHIQRNVKQDVSVSFPMKLNKNEQTITKSDKNMTSKCLFKSKYFCKIDILNSFCPKCQMYFLNLNIVNYLYINNQENDILAEKSLIN